MADCCYWAPNFTSVIRQNTAERENCRRTFPYFSIESWFLMVRSQLAPLVSSFQLFYVNSFDSIIILNSMLWFMPRRPGRCWFLVGFLFSRVCIVDDNSTATLTEVFLFSSSCDTNDVEEERANILRAACNLLGTVGNRDVIWLKNEASAFTQTVSVHNPHLTHLIPTWLTFASHLAFPEGSRHFKPLNYVSANFPRLSRRFFAYRCDLELTIFR